MNLRRNLNNKGIARQLASRFDDLSRANYEEALFLFADQEPYGQLELPIKIDNTHSHRLRRHSDSFSEDLQSTLPHIQSTSSERKNSPLGTVRNIIRYRAHMIPLRN